MTDTTMHRDTRTPGPRIHLATPDATIGEYDGILIVVWRGPPTYELFDNRNALIRDVTARRPGTCGLVEVIESGAPPPPPEMRPYALRVFHEIGDAIGFIVFLLDSSDVRTTLNRAILTGMSFLMPQPRPSKVFKSAQALASWVGDHSDRSSGFPETLARSIKFVRQASHAAP